MAEIVAKQSALESYAQQIKADNETLNQLLYAKLLCCGRLGKLLPRQKAGRPKNGDERIGLPVDQFTKQNLSTYRKIGDHFDRRRVGRQFARLHTLKQVGTVTK